MREVQLARLLDGVPQADNFQLAEVARPEPGPGQLLIRTIYLSLDPYLRGAISGRHMGHDPVKLGQVIPGRIVGQVALSKDDRFQAGDYVFTDASWAEWVVQPAAAVEKLDPAFPLSAYLGALGMPGLTAYAGVTELLRPLPGDTLLVSAATGAVGSAVGQLARIAGCRVVGIAGGPEKCAIATGSYGFDACIDYKADGWKAALAAALPGGANHYFDNVGGDMLATALTQLALYGKVALCGLISQYNETVPPPGPNLGIVVAKRAQLFGLVVYDYDRLKSQQVARMGRWLNDGRLKHTEDRAEGLGQAGAHFHKLMAGHNIGKPIVVVGPEKA